MNTKGIILAGGNGTRLYPLTAAFSKQLQLIYDKPMIYYSLATLMLIGIRDILLISTPDDIPNFKKLLKDGSQWGISIRYKIQDKPQGIAQAFLLGEEFIDNDQVCLILGDNIFYGKLDFLRNSLKENTGATIYGYKVNNPQSYGVVEFNSDNKVISIEEKPHNPKSDYAIPGIYIFDKRCIEFAKKSKPSKRGEFEITDIQNKYLQINELSVKIIGRGIAWFDTGTPESLLEAGTFIHAIEKRQGNKIACLEEIALFMNYISREQYIKLLDSLPECSYKEYCKSIIK